MPRYDLLIVGGGPAGLAALAEASVVGLRAALVDERVTLGGQIYKQPGPGFEIRDHAGLGRDHVAGRRLIDAAVATGAPIMSATSVVAIRGGVVVLVPEGERATTVEADHVLLAPGAYDRPVAFPGWTLPGVLTAGGMQTLAKTQRVLPGERTVFAGSGPLALAFPAQLQALGADVAAVLEAGLPPRPVDLARMLRAARGNVDLLRDAARYRARLVRARVPLRYRRIVVRAEGEGRVEAVVHAAADRDWRPLPDTEERIVADTLCLGYGFTPSTELPRLAGCAFGHDPERGGPVVTVDGWMRTSVPRVFAAGDGTGVEGAYVAQDEGRLAALGAALDSGRITAQAARTAAAPIRRRLRRRRALRAALGRMHAFGAGIDELADAATVVCRCEEVTLAQLDEAVATTADVSVVKGLSRAGMGLCQGRNCQHQVAALIARRHGLPIADVPVATPRSPVRPVPLGAIADAEQEDERFFTAPRERAVTELLARARQRDDLPADTDVLIVGGGIMGSALAYFLARQGVAVVLLERGELNREASGTNAGSFHLQIAIHQLTGLETDSIGDRLLTDVRLNVEAGRLWEALERELDAPLDVHITGGLMVAETAAELRLLNDKQRLEARGGLETHVLTGEELRSFAPYLADDLAGATYCPREGHVNPLVVAPVFALRAAEAGAEIRSGTPVTAIAPRAGGGFDVHTPAGTVRARRVVNAAGAWADDVGRLVGLALPLRREGLHVNVTEPRARLLEPLIQHIGRRLTLKQSSNLTFIIGGGWAARPEPPPARYSTRWESAAGNAAVAVRVVPALADVRLLRTWTGVMTFTNDFTPVVGESARMPGFHMLVVTTGFTLGPLLALRLAEQLTGTGPDLPPEYSPDRPSAASPAAT